ncbi:cysteine desulfurase family protein [Cytophagaceae bacterium YF14B1]|uniref:cysteine desulfurase n=1 Tax=Xanthocytophaga flava TaxID=3048013 RepID=A0AAE3U980_9BACT|nr:cysteine desulfurase family protein [Xanthocytophaga flavus]MDJ1484784.1 cysteine desulfurase family protein [Xanthocytophaga flavus]
MEIYFDNAATTPLDSQVLEAMLPYLGKHHGNPSSTHQYGRRAKDAVESARNTIATLLHASPEEIFFTSGATEANNLALAGSIHTLRFRHFITSPLEHDSVLKSLDFYRKNYQIRVSLVETDAWGRVNLGHLQYLLQKNPASFVSLMHGNNEIGNLNDIEEIGSICRTYKAVFHSDTVQTLGKRRLNLSKVPVHFLVGSAHKFHGPKGIGFLYVNKQIHLQPLMHGGSQEKSLRAGTENVAGIVGLSTALSLAYENLDDTQKYLQKLKGYLIRRLKEIFPQLTFNGDSDQQDKSLPSIVNIGFPALGDRALVDILNEKGIYVSGGSACSNLVEHGSHVLRQLGRNLELENIRFSFSKYNTLAEVDYLVKILSNLYEPQNILHYVGVAK